MQKWEYMLLQRGYFYGSLLKEKGIKEARVGWYWLDDFKLEQGITERFAELGAQGWELISVVAGAVNKYEAWAGDTTQYDYYFKRPVEK